MSSAITLDQALLMRRGQRLEYFTIAWNGIEGIAAVVLGALAGSIALVGFGLDSMIEIISGTALLWRLSGNDRENTEWIALRIVGLCFIALAASIGRT